ncbi:ion transporter [Alkalibacillus aidingensis]|uniref:ion transporter n=1 Tax=Alkalibacillus aidingensis TaxID=2747607 RepID=UPI0016604293|nr:ion transporter [Alkalibacillus aidingensis]
MQTIRQLSAKIVEHKLFQPTIIILILINAVIVGMESYRGLYENYGNWFIRIDTIILTIFTIEIIIKLLASRPMRLFFKDGWNVFDFFIVASSFIFMGSPFVTVLRILRVIRVFRTISVIPSLRKMVNALILTLPSLGTIMILLGVMFYVFSVVGTFLFRDVAPEYFGTLQHTMLTLFQIITLESWASNIMRPVMAELWWSWIYFVAFVLAGTFVVLNLFVGVIVNNFEKIEKMENEDEEPEDLQEEVHMLRKEIKELKDLIKNR